MRDIKILFISLKQIIDPLVKSIEQQALRAILFMCETHLFFKLKIEIFWIKIKSVFDFRESIEKKHKKNCMFFKHEKWENSRQKNGIYVTKGKNSCVGIHKACLSPKQNMKLYFFIYCIFLSVDIFFFFWSWIWNIFYDAVEFILLCMSAFTWQQRRQQFNFHNLCVCY